MKYIEQKILIVDDDKQIITILEKLLSPFGCQILTALNGTDALEVAKQSVPDLVLLDVMLPDMDGYKVCSLLKKDSNTKNTAIIFLTARVNEEGEAVGFELGANDYITKPFKTSILLARVQTQLDLKLHRDMLDSLVAERTKQLLEKEKRYFQLAQEFKGVLDAFQDVLLVVTPGKNITWANAAAAKTFTKPLDDIINQKCCTVWPFSSACDKCIVQETVLTTKPNISRHTDTSLRAWELRSFPVTDSNGNVVSVVIDGIDISEKLNLETKVMRNAHLASLGIMAAGVVHEIENPNHFMTISAEIAEKISRDLLLFAEKNEKDQNTELFGGLPFSEVKKNLPELFHGIRQGAKRISSIVAQLGQFSRQGSCNTKTNVSLNQVIRNVVKLLGLHIHQKAKSCELSLDSRLPPVNGNTCQLEQVITNLILNALESLSCKDEEIKVSSHFHLQEKKVVVKVCDNGAGMSQEVLPNIFEPFYTTKFAEGGTGLGLFISQSIINDHNGSLHFESRPGQGTTVTLSLPTISHSD
ncbi:MAG: response regulator [Desulfobulbaceae bacterium]|nr:response regulator [Desulfobulbaceae bacterium]